MLLAAADVVVQTPSEARTTALPITIRRVDGTTRERREERDMAASWGTSTPCPLQDAFLP